MDRQNTETAVNMTATQCRSSVSLEAILPDYYRPLSLALDQVLEDTGASAEIRNMWQDTFATMELLKTIAYQPELSFYTFGSSREGTTNFEMRPDRDTVLVDNRLPVITDCSYVSGEKGLLLVQDNDTQAGYAKLQMVCNGVPLFQNTYGILNAMQFNTRSPICKFADKYNRLVIAFTPVPGMEMHGPAMFADHGPFSTDSVFAFSLSKLPDCVDEWVARTRNYNWPSVDVIDHCKTLGCLFVPVGHPHSDEQHLEWRVSLSQQERLLVSQFSLVQHKCYILLKFWKKDILPSWIRQESLSSYHCKTCLFYMIENTPSDFWRPDNILVCFVACLKLFLFWTTNGICPNYFIPAENMFDRRIHDELQHNLQQALEDMLTQDCKYLTKISTSNIGDRLLSCVTVPISNRNDYSEGLSYYNGTKGMMVRQIEALAFHYKHYLIQKYFSNSSQQCLINLYNQCQSLKHTPRITEHTEEETQRAISCIVSHLDLHLMTNMVALAKQQGRSREEIWRFLFSDSWHQLSLRSDISVKLKQASLMYMFEYYHASLDILSSIELRGVYSYCSCYNIELTALPTDDDWITAGANQPAVTMERMANRLFVQCLVFLPAERNVIPDALCYEMLRFVDHPPGHTDGLKFDYLRECAVVDGLFLFHFLLFLNHSKLNMRSHVRADIDNMNYIINARDLWNWPKCSHREACLNILGWVYKDQGCVETAVECFRRSLEMKPRGNAAAWHLRDLQNTSQ